MIAMCHTRVMRHALIFLVCAAGFAQAPGTLDPSKAPGATQPPAQEAPGQLAPAPLQDSGDFKLGTTVNVVVAPTTVRDRNGDFVNGLQLQDFQLYDNNKLQKVSADVRDEPLSLVVAVQRSSNLTDFLPKIQRIGTQLNQLVAQ